MSEITKSLVEILELFFKQVDLRNLKVSHYPENYSGLNLKVSFGQGTISNVPWIAFLKDGKSVKSGIFPVLLYYKEQELLVLAYGIGEEKTSEETWGIDEQLISDWFTENNLDVPYRYGNSMIYKVYKRQNLDFEKISSDVDALIDLYNKIDFQVNNHLALNTISTPSYWLVKTGTNGNEWNYFQRNKMISLMYGNWRDLSEFPNKEALKDAISSIEPTWSGSSKNHISNLWQFSHEIKVGDIIIAAKGTKTYLGYGVVTSPYYHYHKNYGPRHRINVDWKRKGEWYIEEKEAGFNIKTLLLMDQYKPWPQNVIKMMDGELITNSELAYTKVDALSELFIDESTLDKVLITLERKKNIVLQGPPGTGKSFIAKRLAYCALGIKDSSKVEMVQFHQSYSYEDFIQGYRPTESGAFALQDGVFYRFCQKAHADPDNKYFFIIDEINRGNLSKIFGELMLLIESDKRGEHYAVSLTYSANSETFYVPNNVYIIGTMNTADRSLAVVDYALRRRFSFIHIHPNFEEKLRNYLSTILDKKLVNKIAERLTALNRQIKSDPHLGDGFLIGHSYFCNLQKSENHDSWYEDIVKFEIEPLLKEYWFDDLEKANTAAEKLLE